MVLLVEGAPLPRCPASTDDFFACWPQVAEAGRNFAGQKVRPVEARHALYVGQGEFGVVPGGDPRVRVVGSDDATTCHMVVVRHPSGTVAVAHFDGSRGEEAALGDMVAKIMGIEGHGEGLEVSVVGGYQPERGSKEAARAEAEQLSLKLLEALVRHECHFQLCVWCTCRLNTTQSASGPHPRVYGVAVEIQSGTLFPAHFKMQEPDMPLRSASRWMAGGRHPLDLYDHSSGTITIHPFHCSEADLFAVYLKLPDDVLLRNFSTSPKVEPPHFCQELRRVFKVFVDHPRPLESLFVGNRPKKYAISASGVWEPVQ
ncbi:Protein N-terminal asparagine amidohydrolase [Portunus trituberculatus]|uniref:Protein N-terminal asparagine amidohydrolase n=1 Tax=Portunus trituberculatus TaxID=210409 RepID=A0A5B7D0Q1_PORTR|nr:Protein N-terminal asparagine amidohydrolase [Portunus trituberculatus]